MNSIVQKHWGYYEILKSGKRFLVKKLFIKPGGMLSLQNHDHRSEHWLVAEGEVEVTLDKKTKKNKGSAIFIHLTKNYNPTAGCIAISKKDFLILIKLINKNTKISIS